MAGGTTRKAGVEFFVKGAEAVVSAVAKVSDAMVDFNTQVSKTGDIKLDTSKLTDEAEKLKSIFETPGLMKFPAPELDTAQWNRVAEILKDTSAEATDFAEKFQAATVIAKAESRAMAESSAEATAELAKLGTAMGALGAAVAGMLVGMGLVASRIEELGNILEVTRVNAIELAEAEHHEAEAARKLTRSTQESVEEHDALARAAKLTGAAVESEVKSVRALHLSGTVANEAVAQMIRYNLDWTRANELAREAQDAATYAMQDSSVAMNGLIQGIITLQPRLLRTYGIMINLDIAYEKWAQANNVAVKEMSVTQRQQAALNEVLAKAPSIAGAYEASMTTAAKQLRSLKTDTIDLSEAFGRGLTPALNTGVTGFRGVLRWLIELPEPTQAFISQTAALSAGMTLFTGVALKTIPTMQKLAAAIKEVGVVQAIFGSSLSASVIGISGIVTAVSAAALAYYQYVTAQRAAAAAILEASDSYTGYIGQLENAEKAQYAFSESLWETYRASLATMNVLNAKELQTAASQVKGMFVNVAPTLAQALTSTETLIERMTALQLVAASDVDYMRMVAQQMGKNGKEADDYAESIVALAVAERQRRGEIVSTNYLERERYELYMDLLPAQWEATRASTDEAAQLSLLERRLYSANGALLDWIKSQELERETADDVAKSIWAEIDAAHQRTLSFKDLEYEYNQKKTDLAQETRDALDEIDQQIADLHAGVLDAMLDLDEEYANKQQDLARDLQDALLDAKEDYNNKVSDADKEYANKQKDLAEDLHNSLLDAEEDYNNKVADLHEDLLRAQQDKERDYNNDLEDEAENHGHRIEEINREYQQDVLDIEEEYAQKRAELDAEHTEKQSDIQESYKEARIHELERLGMDEEYIREHWNDEMMQGPLADAMQEELAALEEQYAQESTDLDRALADELEQRDEALQEQLTDEERRYAEWREERLGNYQQDLEDLQIKHQREEEEAQLSYDRKREDLLRDNELRLRDLGEQHQREEEEAQLSYDRKREDLLKDNKRRLRDLSEQHQREEEELLKSLEDKREEILKKQAEEAADIEKWHLDRMSEIDREYGKQRDEIAYQLGQTNIKAAEMLGLLPDALKPAYTAMKEQAATQMGEWTGIILDQIQALFDALLIHSPSRVMEKLGVGIMSGLEKGLNSQSLSDMLGESLQADALKMNVLGSYGNMPNVLPTMAGMSGATNYDNRAVNLSMPTTVNSGMDAAVFQQMVLRTVSQALRYG